MANHQGDFVWYELMSPDPDDARAFYEAVVGWQIEAVASGPMDYRMIATEIGPVAGLMPLTAEMQARGARPAWLGYVAVDDVDAMVKSIEDGGGAVMMQPSDTPGVGRIACVAASQGATLYIMKPIPPVGNPDMESLAFSYDKPLDGHCAWNDLATSDPAAALRFYGQRFGWVKDGEMDMGPMGTYEFFKRAGSTIDGLMQGMIGAVMPKMPQIPVSTWTYYFRVPDIDTAAAAVTAHGGEIVTQPIEIPGGDFSLMGVDPQGAAFALVGSRSK